ncbi:hypothetical protein ACIP79_26395 [Streptomyces sp. NPDC088747]|uniref:hypothetical protein n=1 Tax=Streptomyces sp. NPDC088747 TaxID=3365886 RepID=UPI003801B263
MSDNDTSSATTSSDPATAEASSPDLVQVVLGDCSVADADTVFRALGSRFASERGDDTPAQRSDTEPDTWTSAFLVPESAAPLSGTILAGSVTADLQGGPVAVSRMRAALASGFAVEATGSASGDQEVDLQLRLTAAGNLA